MNDICDHCKETIAFSVVVKDERVKEILPYIPAPEDLAYDFY